MRRLLLLLLALSSYACAAERPPNIVLILADDLGINDLSCYGRRDQPTPVLDRLAAQGIRFTCAYCAQPICSPSRAALLTGRSPARLHLTTYLPGRPDKPSQKLLQPKIEMQLPLEEVTLAEALKPAGYVSACIGKWHLGGAGFGPREQGFDSVFEGPQNTTPSATEGGKDEYGLTARAIEFMQQNREQPFFLYLAHHSPHIPLNAQEALISAHAGAFNPLYAAMIETLDRTIGLVLAQLDELGLAEKTIVIFTSDNGGLHVPESPRTPATLNTPFRGGKGYLYEGGLREPLLIRWPGRLAAGRIIETPVSLGDLMPTLLEWTGTAPTALLDFQSLASLLNGTGGTRTPEFYWHFPHYSNQGGRPAGAVRVGDWKLIEHYEDGRAELFDLAQDPGETTDLAARKPQRAAEMRGQLATWRLSVGAQENAPNPNFDLGWYNDIYGDLDTSRLPSQPTAALTRAALLDWRAALDRPAAKAIGTAPSAPGYLILPAREAIIHGTALRYEAQPIKNTLDFWKYATDTASWTLSLPASGRYAVEALVGCGPGSGGAVVQITAGGQPISFRVEETGHFQNFVPQAVGTLRLAAGLNTVTVAPQTKPGPTVMDLRQLTLTKISD